MSPSNQRNIRPRGRLRQRGFTLLELIVSVGIMGSLGGAIVTSSYAMFRAQHDTNAHAGVAIEVSKSITWLTRDVHRAATSDLVDGGGGVATASFTWSDGGVLTTCTYDVDGGSNRLRRTCSGASQFVTNGVSNLQFTRAGDLVNVSYLLTSPQEPDYTENVSMNILIGGG